MVVTAQIHLLGPGASWRSHARVNRLLWVGRSPDSRGEGGVPYAARVEAGLGPKYHKKNGRVKYFPGVTQQAMPAQPTKVRRASVPHMKTLLFQVPQRDFSIIPPALPTGAEPPPAALLSSQGLVPGTVSGLNTNDRGASQELLGAANPFRTHERH